MKEDRRLDEGGRGGKRQDKAGRAQARRSYYRCGLAYARRIPLDTAQRLRPDSITETNDRDRYQENAAAVADGLYLVPKVLE